MSELPDHAHIASFRNLGPASASWLEAVDIRTVGDLRKLGSGLAFHIVRQRFPKANILLLYAMEAGLQDRHWQDLSPEERASLREEARSV